MAVISLLDRIRSYWDEDANTYDLASGHRPRSPAERAAWSAALARMLPAAPARVLDVGAGTGFLSLTAARLGHRVTAMDLSEGMLERLRSAARAEGLEIEVLAAPATDPPSGFDAVIERHLLWTLPDPAGTLYAWREATPSGRLVLVESVWGANDPFESARSRLREILRRVKRRPPDHHRPYPPAVREALPLGSGTPPGRVVEMVAAAGWPEPRLQRLWDVEWASSSAMGPLERLLGVPPRFAVVAG